jgi:hypothetical protein
LSRRSADPRRLQRLLRRLGRSYPGREIGGKAITAASPRPSHRLTGSKRVLEMSADIINLRRARKAKERREAEATASENRANFGRAKAERQASRAEKDLAARRLDANRREPSGDEPPK